MIKFLRTHLAWKLFLSYIIVVLVGVIVLASATSLAVPAAYEHHMSGMNGMMGGMSGIGNTHNDDRDLFNNYSDAVMEAVSLAAGAALLVAVLASFFISRQIVRPVQQMQTISQKISKGEYEERLEINGNLPLNQLDELNQLALSFNQMAEKLEKTELMRRQLLGDVSHELRTPLTAIKGYMEGLMDNVLPAEPETFQQVYSEADRLQRLVNDLQELSIVEAKAYPLKLEDVSPQTLIESVSAHLQRQYEDKGVQLEARTIGDLPDLHVDKDRILQVLTNLVGNALQFTPQGGKVTVLAARQEQEIIFSVTDSGCGIAPDQLPLIFNRFYRTDKSRARASGGSGIGLTIAKALVQAHQGRIWAESAGDGQGSTFLFALPITTQD